MFRIKGYEPGANISILNTIYHKAQKQEDGSYGKDSLDIIFKDLDTGQKHLEHIVEPTYTFYEANSNVNIPTNVLWIEKEKVHPVECKYRNVLKTIADHTNNTNYFYDNIRNGNYKENDRLFYIPSILNADMNIEDYYRVEFAKTYKNESFDPDLLFFDIEVDGIDLPPGTFPGPGQCPVNAVTLIDDKYKNIYCLLLNNDKNPQIKEFMNEKDLNTQLKNFVQEKVGGWKNEKRFKLDDFKYSIMFYDEEIKLIWDVFNTINTIKPDFVLAWNIAFDLPYLIERIRLLGYSPIDIICHNDFPVKECWYFVDKQAQKFEERNDYATISCYSVYLDQLITFASRRKGQKKKKITSFKLDFIGDVVAGVRKLDYSSITHNIMKLPYLNYKTFAFYNVMDTIVQLCIERKVGDISFLLSKALSTHTRYAKIHRQTTYLINRATKDFYDMGYIIGNNINKHNEKDEFAGAYVGDPLLVSDKPKMKINGRPISICENCDDFDYARLYPSIIDENNMAPPTQHGKVLFPNKLDPKEDRFNNPYFDRTVWFIEDLVSNNYLDFCHRYLNLATYEEMYDDILKFYTELCNSNKYPILYTENGKIMCYVVPDNKIGKELCIIDDKEKIMCKIVDKMPRRTNNDIKSK